MDLDTSINNLTAQLAPITLDEMGGIKLMNRTDTKFVTDKAHLVQLLKLVQGKYFAQEIGGQRIANYRTTYWDTPWHRFFLEHHNGRAPRQKIRVRTYMDSDLTFLEVKTKNNHGRTKKKRITVPSQERADVVQAGGSDFTKGLTGATFDDILPTVQNQFQRITLVNYGKTERLTIDFNVHFHNFETGNATGTGDLVIIELKRDGNVFSPVLDMLRQLRIKPSGFSKYCIGSVMTNGQLKNNLFKPKMVRISKLTGFHFHPANT
ncbi:MAG: polyphosphate polymerase domain-containing protein [Prevotella sp.]|nr:polyphosphate polymerase domain-containing protein [Prevotella sp.]MBR3514486.1 polyphosphate polymerase domain-containing protein [Bacteroidaceae bacterium]